MTWWYRLLACATWLLALPVRMFLSLMAQDIANHLCELQRDGWRDPQRNQTLRRYRKLERWLRWRRRNLDWEHLLRGRP